MIKEEFTMHNSEGLHLRTGMLLSKIIKKYDCVSKIHFNGKEIDLKSVLNVVAACVTQGSKFAISCDGPQEKECMDAIIDFSKDNFY